MYAAIYLFRTHPETENEFVKAWEDLTLMIRKYEGSLGSRLHRSEADVREFFAYALWPDGKTYKEAGNSMPPEVEDIRRRMREACENIETTFTGEVGEDFIIDQPESL